jgi:hypothetical protein
MACNALDMGGAGSKSLYERLTFESLAKGPKNNGGKVVFKRAVGMSLVVSAAYLGFHNLSIWVGSSFTPKFEPLEVANQLRGMAPNLGWIFAGIYTALYTRFASQWSYLANVYNQIKAAECQAQAGTGTERPPVPAIGHWKAAYISDARELHLINKPSVASTVWHWTDDAAVMEHLLPDDDVGRHKLKDMLSAVGRSAKPRKSPERIAQQVQDRMALVPQIRRSSPPGESDPPKAEAA